MSEDKTGYIGCAIILLIVGGIYTYSYYQEKSGSVQEKQQIESKDKEEALKKDKIDIFKNDLAKKYDALIGWDKDQQYTIQLQNDLIIPDKPILFTGQIEDVFKKDNDFFVRFFGNELTSYLYVELKCNKEKVDELLVLETENDTGINEYYAKEYAVVAKLDSIRKKTTIDVNGSVNDDGEVDLSYDPSNGFIATGSCIDILQIEGDS